MQLFTQFVLLFVLGVFFVQLYVTLTSTLMMGTHWACQSARFCTLSHASGVSSSIRRRFPSTFSWSVGPINTHRCIQRGRPQLQPSRQTPCHPDRRTQLGLRWRGQGRGQARHLHQAGPRHAIKQMAEHERQTTPNATTLLKQIIVICYKCIATGAASQN